MSELEPTGMPNNYAARSFESMINSNPPHTEHHWGLLLDWDEAICYSLIVAEKTGRKVRVIAEQGAWLAYETGKSTEGTGTS